MKTLIYILLTILLVGHPGAGVKIEAEPAKPAEPTVKTKSVKEISSQATGNLVIDLTNQERVKAGLMPLQESLQLNTSATTKACDMRDRNYWAHVAPDGTQPWSFFIDAGYTYRFAGENMCRDFSDDKCVKLLMASKTHRENILSPDFKEIGIGKCGVFTVQHFGTRR